MYNFIHSSHGRHLAILLVALMLAIGVSPKAAMAGFVANTEIDRAQDMAAVQTTLENKMVAEQLKAYGYTPAEIEATLGQLSDMELHQLAGQLDGATTPSGGAAGVVLGVAVVILVALGVMSLMGKRVVVSE